MVPNTRALDVFGLQFPEALENSIKGPYQLRLLGVTICRSNLRVSSTKRCTRTLSFGERECPVASASYTSKQMFQISFKDLVTLLLKRHF